MSEKSPAPKWRNMLAASAAASAGNLRSVLIASTTAGVIVTAVVFAFNGSAVSAQDKYTVQVPDGLAFSEFRGFEDWATVAVSQSGDLIEVILANPTMIDAYRAGAPGNGKPFPDGSKMAKIHWTWKKSTEAPAPTIVPSTLHDVDFMARDSKRFSHTGNWGYAQFDYENSSDTFKPHQTGADCGYACHTIVKDKDYVFTAYGKR
jgi:Cytochrome P460